MWCMTRSLHPSPTYNLMIYLTFKTYTYKGGSSVSTFLRVYITLYPSIPRNSQNTRNNTVPVASHLRACHSISMGHHTANHNQEETSLKAGGCFWKTSKTFLTDDDYLQCPQTLDHIIASRIQQNHQSGNSLMPREDTLSASLHSKQQKSWDGKCLPTCAPFIGELSLKLTSNPCTDTARAIFHSAAPHCHLCAPLNRRQLKKLSLT